MKKAGVLLLLIFFLQQFIFAQLTIIGTVTSADDGLGLPGVNVVIKGTTTGAVTDIDGKYSLKVQQGSTLMFSFIGMESQEILVTDQTVIDVVLKSAVTTVEEVIVAGVASATPKSKISVSVNKVDAKDLESVPAVSTASALQGRVAGLVVVNSSGNPGESSGIRLRGSTSLFGNSSPLIIVDGIMMEGDMADINGDDVASYEIVKGASASALYGSRAGNGVIVITTKRGNSAKENHTEIRYRGEYGMSNLVKEIKLSEHHAYRLNTDYSQNGYTKYYGVTYPENYDGGPTNEITGTRIPDFDHYSDNPYYKVNDLQKDILPNGNFYTNYISIATNNVNSAVLASFESNHNSGIVFNKHGYDRENYRLNLDQKIFEKFKLSISSLATQSRIDLPNGGTTVSDGGGSLSSFADVLFMNPDANLNMNAPDTMKINGSNKYYIKPDNWALAGNPKHSLYYETRNTKKNSLMQNYSLNYKPLGWLELVANYSYEKRDITYSISDPKGFMGLNGAYKTGFANKIAYGSLSETFQTTININQKINNWTVKSKLNYTFEQFLSDEFSVDGVHFLFSGVNSLQSIIGNKNITSFQITTRAKDYSGIVDLDYKGKYIASVLYRVDGSSLFGANQRWNPYYRISGAYRLNEDLKIEGIQEMKLRAAIGTSGQRPGFDYQYETFTMDNGVAVGYTSGNKNLKPSETKETEVAFNIEFLKRFEIEIIQSFNETNGDFMEVPLSAVTGFRYQWQNAAKIKGTSFEATLSTKIANSKDFNWKFNITFDKVTQKINELKVPPFSYGPKSAFHVAAGQPYGTMYGYDWIRSLDQLPSGKNRDDYVVNSEGYVIPKGSEGTSLEVPLIYDKNNGLNYQIADMNPKFNMSFSTILEYKNILFSMLWNWKCGGDIYNATKQRLYLDQRAGVNDQYGKPEYQKKTTDYYTAFYFKDGVNSYFVEDGSYIKLREMSVYYTLGPDFFSKGKFSFMRGAKIGILGRNLLTFTKYTGWDPEVSDISNPTTFIIDDFSYPNYRTISVSLELKF
jgi:TonB-linked SusC/RagA family outer membrane protein